MLKPTFSVLIISMSLALSACSDKNDTSVQLSASEITADTTTPQTQTLRSSDDKISITAVGSHFSDQMANAAQWISANEQNKLILLQHDDNSGITLSVSKLGAPKTNADDYFKQLADTLKTDSKLSDVSVGAATENRMNYRFAYSQDEVTLNENCVAIYEPNNLYIACASSDSADQQQLADTLKNISIKQ